MQPRRFDPIADVRKVFIEHLQTENPGASILLDAAIDPTVPWRPHVLDETRGVAWHIMTEFVDTDNWIRRIQKAQDARTNVRVGVCLTEHLLHTNESDENQDPSNEVLIQHLNDLGCKVAVVPDDQRAPVVVSNTVADVIYETGLRLSPRAASLILDRLLQRCSEAKTNAEKGVSLEVLSAVLLSQVDGFTVDAVGVSNRSQEADVLVHNRNVGGILGRSSIVLVEAKNWRKPPQASEYSLFLRKVQSKYGLCRLGYLVTTGRFTAGVEDERLRDSTGKVLIVPLDRVTLPAIWRGMRRGETITTRIEAATIKAASRT